MKIMLDYNIIRTHPENIDAKQLQDALSEDLYNRFGSDGRNSFQDWINNDRRFVFILIKNDSEAIGCGAIRPISSEVAELKRMFAKYKRKGIGKMILNALEKEAQEIGYKKIWLETRIVNEEARSFYTINGYKEIENFGKYKGRENAICFEKIL
jgi:GNAT superfamily N-acetyltransferase